jgi:hypothetical protein
MVEVINLAWIQWADGGFTMLDSDAMEITNCLHKAVAYDEIEKAGGVMEHLWNAPADMKQDFLAKLHAKSE